MSLAYLSLTLLIMFEFFASNNFGAIEFSILSILYLLALSFIVKKERQE